MPQQTILDIPAEQQAAMLRELRRWRYGLLLSARGRTPTEIADFLFCSRSSVYRAVAAFRAGKFDRLCQPSAEEPSVTPPAEPVSATPAAAHRAAAAPLRLVSDPVELRHAGAHYHGPHRSLVFARIGSPRTPRARVGLEAGETPGA